MLDKLWAPKPLSSWLCKDFPAKICAKRKKDVGCSWMVWARGREAGWNVPFVVAWIKRSLKEDYWLEQISWLFYLEKSKASFLYGLSSTHWPVELEGILNQLGCHAPNFQGLPGLTTTWGVCYVPSVAYPGRSYPPWTHYPFLILLFFKRKIC